jgi:RNA polymerase sigma factor (sigma-70 family)
VGVSITEDTILVQKARSEGAAGFEPLVRRYQDQGLRIATLLLGDRDEAQDAVQDAFVKAYRSLGTLADDHGFGRWFRTILRNGCRDRLRAPSRRQEPIDELHPERYGSDAATSDNLERNDLSAIIRRAMQRLTPDHREILVLKEIEEMNYAEIAAALGITEGTVGSRLHHARLALRRVLVRQGITLEEVL